MKQRFLQLGLSQESAGSCWASCSFTIVSVPIGQDVNHLSIVNGKQEAASCSYCMSALGKSGMILSFSKGYEKAYPWSTLWASKDPIPHPQPFKKEFAPIWHAPQGALWITVNVFRHSGLLQRLQSCFEEMQKSQQSLFSALTACFAVPCTSYLKDC